MLKLHPHQVTSHTVQTLCPSATNGGGALEGSGDLCPPSWVLVEEGGGGNVILPNLCSSACGDLAELRDAVRNEGLLAYYVAMATTDLGTE